MALIGSWIVTGSAGMARPGKLDQRITLQAYAEVSDGGGGSTKTWADLPSVPNVWAMVRTAPGDERFEDGRVNADAVSEFTIRNRSDIDERCRISWGGEYYNIRSIMREGTRALYVKIRAERGVSN